MSDFPKLSSSAAFLLHQIAKEKINPKQLTPHQRRVCVRFLLTERKHTQLEIATILHVSESVVSKDKRKTLEQNCWMIDFIDERQIAVDIAQTADIASARLFRKGKEKEAFDVRRQAVDTLQSLGYLKRAPIEFRGKLTLEEILKLASEPEVEEHLSEGTGRGSKAAITNGSH